jgi:hypothetical protein
MVVFELEPFQRRVCSRCAGEADRRCAYVLRDGRRTVYVCRGCDRELEEEEKRWQKSYSTIPRLR